MTLGEVIERLADRESGLRTVGERETAMRQAWAEWRRQEFDNRLPGRPTVPLETETIVGGVSQHFPPQEKEPHG